MNDGQMIETLESEWEPDVGFFWQIRQGIFAENEFRRALATVSSIEISDSHVIERRVVSLLWYIPLFMHWQTERVAEAGGNVESYAQAVSAMTNEVERLLGVP